MATKIRLDSKGIAAMLNSREVAGAVSSLASSVASGAEGATAGGDSIPVQTRTRTASGGRLSPRTAVDVTLAHPAGLRVEALRGTLVRAASSAGLEVTSRS